MHSETRQKLETYHRHLAQLNGVASVSQQYNATPSVEQSLKEKMGEQVDFLSRINVMGVTEMTGEPLLLNSGSTIAGRTNTSGGNTRATTDPSGLEKREYALKQTNFDSHLTYAKLDAWAKFPNFATLIANQRALQIARDRLMIGWNGTSAAADTNRSTHALLQDVNIGWIQKLKTEKSSSVLSDLKLGEASGNDYKNLDALVYDAAGTVLPEWYQNDTSLVVFTSRKMVKDKMLAILQATDNKATENEALRTIITQQTAGGMPVHVVPFIPERSMVITSYDNLSIYYQSGKQRMHVQDKPERDRVEYYQSSNEAYVIEDLDKMVVVENVKLHDGSAWS